MKVSECDGPVRERTCGDCVVAHNTENSFYEYSEIMQLHNTEMCAEHMTRDSRETVVFARKGGHCVPGKKVPAFYI
jgi:hypothetical protein